MSTAVDPRSLPGRHHASRRDAGFLARKPHRQLLQPGPRDRRDLFAVPRPSRPSLHPRRGSRGADRRLGRGAVRPQGDRRWAHHRPGDRQCRGVRHGEGRGRILADLRRCNSIAGQSINAAQLRRREHGRHGSADGRPQRRWVKAASGAGEVGASEHTKWPSRFEGLSSCSFGAGCVHRSDQRFTKTQLTSYHPIACREMHSTLSFGIRMSGPMLYSTNPYYAIEVASNYRSGKFYAWCSEVFSAGQQAGSAPSRLIAPSSDPKTIYEQLHTAVEREASHAARIIGYKKTFKRLARSWQSKGEISLSQRAEIIAVCSRTSYQIWRPYLFMIPRANVTKKLTTVSAKKRAGHGNEFIVDELLAAEFDILELPLLGGR